jgi:pyruvate formate lyase activating enzyme
MIIKIERFALHDGPGIRTVIFLKGCPLRCAWCSNPESQVLHEETFRKPKLEPVGRRVNVDELMNVVRRDYPYYSASGGGVTLTGGEPLLQPAFAQAILQACKTENIHTTIETSGFAQWADWERVLPVLDLVCFDLKHPDSGAHARLTGVENHSILENLRRVAASGVLVTIRIPLVPGLNESPGALEGFAAIMQSLKLRTVHLLPYHEMGSNKYGWLGRVYELSTLKTHTAEQLAEILAFFASKGFAAQIGG